MSSLKVKSVNWSKVHGLMEQLTLSSEEAGQFTSGASMKKASKAAPGAVLQVALGDAVLLQQAYGSRSLLPSQSMLSTDTVFDVSSLTKPLITTCLIMYLHDKGLLELDKRVTHLLQGFSIHGKERMTVRHLLAHCSGYTDHLPFYKRIAKADGAARCGFMATSDAAQSVYHELFRSKLENLPGKVNKYSDLGFMLLGHIIESVSNVRLGKLAEKVLFAPLQMRSSGFVDLSMIRRKALVTVNDAIAPSNQCPWRRRLICGEVQDENAWAMGGIAGHAGLFTTAGDIECILGELLACYHGRGTLFRQETVREFWSKEPYTGSDWCLGWDTPAAENSQAGDNFPEGTVGHLGYTGCSIWLHPESELRVTLLTNRLHPDADNDYIKQARPQIHTTVLESIGVLS